MISNTDSSMPEIIRHEQNQMMTMPWIDVFSGMSVAIAALSFAWGVQAWRREFIGKRRIELAESVLALFYEAEDAIREIRSPFGMVGEGKSRERDSTEREEEAEFRDRAYVAFERYQKREKLFAELRSMKYRFMASFGTEAGEPFKELNLIINDIFISARMLCTNYWPRQGRVRMSESEFEKHLSEMHRHEATFWFMTEETDQVGKRMRLAVQQIEEITRREAYPQRSRLLFRRPKRRTVAN